MKREEEARERREQEMRRKSSEHKVERDEHWDKIIPLLGSSNLRIRTRILWFSLFYLLFAMAAFASYIRLPFHFFFFLA